MHEFASGSSLGDLSLGVVLHIASHSRDQRGMHCHITSVVTRFLPTDCLSRENVIELSLW